jgi:hypothetical protein
MKTIRQNCLQLFALCALLLFAGSQALVAQDKDGDKKQPDSNAAVCKPHKIARADCFICDPKLREKGRLWCKEHERYENRCWICHPEAQDKKRLFCKEHSLYEDECFICHPELKKKPAEKAK